PAEPSEPGNGEYGTGPRQRGDTRSGAAECRGTQPLVTAHRQRTTGAEFVVRLPGQLAGECLVDQYRPTACDRGQSAGEIDGGPVDVTEPAQYPTVGHTATNRAQRRIVRGPFGQCQGDLGRAGDVVHDEQDLVPDHFHHVALVLCHHFGGDGLETVQDRAELGFM